MRVILAGGSGFIGRHLAKALTDRGHEVRLLTRGLSPAPQTASRLIWDAKSGGFWEEALGSADAVVNLCGAGVADRPWTAARRRVLKDSRLDSTRAIVDAIAKAGPRPRVLVNASAVGYYGDAGSRELTEASPQGQGFLAELCRAWEDEALRARGLKVRTVLMRIGVVLGLDGGALPRMLPPFRLGLGGRLGSGAQHMPWVHVDDVAGLILTAIEKETYEGPVNAAAPGAATNAEFTAAMGRALHRPTVFPVPAFALRLLLGEMSGMLLGSQKVLPEAALKTGYAFRHPRLDEALTSLLGAR